MTSEKNEQNWFSVEIRTVPEAAEAIEFAFNDLDALGTEINHLGKSVGDNLVVVGYFQIMPSHELLPSVMNEALRIYGLPTDSIQSIEYQEIENKDWLAEWKKHWKPTEIGNFIITPPWEQVDAAGKIVISIEPNMAFGTGTHETTQLCLAAIEKNYKPGQSFLDVGTGTGILAIAAAKTGPRFQIPDSRFLACDTDAESIKIARENAVLNGAGNIEFFVGSIAADTPQFDFVCANLTIDVILPLLPLLIEKMTKTLVLSGILDVQEESIVSELRKSNRTNYNVDRAGEWISVTVQ